MDLWTEDIHLHEVVWTCRPVDLWTEDIHLYEVVWTCGPEDLFQLPPFCFVEYSVNAPAPTHVSTWAEILPRLHASSVYITCITCFLCVGVCFIKESSTNYRVY